MQDLHRGGATMRGAPEKEFQLEVRHMAFLLLLVVALCVASFMLGRWVERQSAGTDIEHAASEQEGRMEDGGDVARDLTFFDSLKNEQPVPLEEGAAGGRAPLKPAPSRAAAAPAPSSRRSVEEGIFIQVIATAQRSAAESVRKRLRDDGYTALMVSEGGTWKVRVGPYADRADAERAAVRLRNEKGLTTWIP